VLTGASPASNPAVVSTVWPGRSILGRVVGPSKVAVVAVYLMSNTALTGATYDVDGGQQLVAR
jgi:NAD(P)-dependent dehydrogenase (short-subunit alcohol dehydrogenase family)